MRLVDGSMRIEDGRMVIRHRGILSVAQSLPIIMSSIKNVTGFIISDVKIYRSSNQQLICIVTAYYLPTGKMSNWLNASSSPITIYFPSSDAAIVLS